MNKILIVEDEIAISDLIKIELESKGYKCNIANDGEIRSEERRVGKECRF